MELKKCSICLIDKSLSDFYRVRAKYMFPYCKECTAVKTVTWKRDNRDKVRSYRLLEKYNLSFQEYSDLYRSVNGMCEICDAQKDVLSVDHDHLTSKIRGLLCANCNHGLGKFFDNPAIIRKALKYVETRI